MKYLRWLFPHWIKKLYHLTKLTEIPKEDRKIRFWCILLTGIFLAYLPIIFIQVISYDLEFVWLWSIPLPLFAVFYWNIPFIMLHALFMNALAYKAILYEPVGDCWRIACIRLKLHVPRIDNLPGKEYPDVVASNARMFRVEAKGYTVEDFLKLRSKICSAAGLFIWSIKPSLDENNKRIPGYIDFYYSREDLPALVNFMEAPETPYGFLNFGLGVDGWRLLPLHKIVHAGFAGLPGSGKSVGLRCLLYQTFLTYPNALVVGIDFKQGSEFHAAEKVGNFILCQTYLETDTALDVVYGEYLRRTELIKAYNVENTYEIILPDGSSIPPVFIFVDEMAEVYISLRKTAPDDVKQAQLNTWERLNQIARLARSTGIHIIWATQRPSANAIDTEVRSMTKTRAAYKLAQVQDSVMFLQRGIATELPGNIEGRYYLQTAAGIFEQLQTMYVSKDDVKALSGKIPSGNPLHSHIKTLKADEVTKHNGQAENLPVIA